MAVTPRTTSRTDPGPDTVTLAPPRPKDGAALWQLAANSAVLDVNSSYAYLLWCRDFAATSVVAHVEGAAAGFVTGYLRPDEPDTLMVWQVAVDRAQRGRGLAGRMLAHLADRVAPRVLETTISPDNQASMALFGAFARDRGVPVEQRTLFDSGTFPDGHEPEVLFRIGPLEER